MTDFDLPYWIGPALVGAALIWEHTLVTPTNLTKVNRSFFTANGFIAIALFTFALTDLTLR